MKVVFRDNVVRIFYVTRNEALMTADELKQAFDSWGITAAQGGKILCLHSNKLSEYLAGVAGIPCAVAFSVEVLELLDDETRQELFTRRLARKAHGAA